MKATKKKIVIVSMSIIVLVAVIIGVVAFLPLGMPSGKDYFQPVGQRTLQKDEIGQWNYVKYQFLEVSASGDTFLHWDHKLQNFWKYSIAFTSYGMPSLAIIDPQQKSLAVYYMALMIEAMKSKKVWQDFVDFGFGADPITYQNIMYKGHLNLMYGLYQLMSGDERYAREYTWLTNQIVKEMRQHHKAGIYDGVTCEPNLYFAQCNSIGLLSLHIYDKLYGTKYTQNEVKWTLDFLKKRMAEKKTGLYAATYFPSHDLVDPAISGYANGWTIAILHVLDPEYNEKLYPIFKKVFVKEIGPYAFVKEDPDAQEPGKNAMGFGMLAAKEMGDVSLFTKLRNSFDKMGGKLVYEKGLNQMRYANADNTIINGMVLMIKMHVGWANILSHDWGYKKTFQIPNVAGMTWKDILPQNIHEMPYLR